MNSISTTARLRSGATEIKAADHDTCITSATVRRMCGGVSDMTLWRWLNTPDMGFPRPFYIRKRRFWREADIRAWLAEREGAEAAA